jgi:uncharacterized membrane protein (DUF373 family)
MGIENDAKNFLVLIVQTVSSIILWLLMNILFGLYLKYGLFDNYPSAINVLYYSLFVAGSIWLFFFFKKRWKNVKFD